MPDSKNAKWVGDYTEDSSPVRNEEPAVAPSHSAANDADGWQQYRHWISKAPAPPSRRARVDRSIYTWKGYRNWTENVKRNWLNDQNDSD